MKIYVQSMDESLTGRDKRAAIRRAQEELLSRALSDAGFLFVDCAEVPLQQKGPHGKPYFPSLPDFHYNFSDSGSYAALAAADSRDGIRSLGLDLQKIVPVRAGIDAMAKRFYTPEEAALLADMEDTAAKQALFFRLWSVKEAFVKCTGDGLTRGIRYFTIDFDARLIRSRDHPAEVLASFEEPKPPEPGYCMAVAVRPMRGSSVTDCGSHSL